MLASASLSLSEQLLLVLHPILHCPCRNEDETFRSSLLFCHNLEDAVRLITHQALCVHGSLPSCSILPPNRVEAAKIIPSSVLSKGALVDELSSVVVFADGGGEVEPEAMGASSSEATSGVAGSCSRDSWCRDCVAEAAAASVFAAAVAVAADVLAILAILHEVIGRVGKASTEHGWSSFTEVRRSK